MVKIQAKSQPLKKGHSFAMLPLPVQALGPQAVLVRGSAKQKHIDRDVIESLRTEQKQQQQQQPAASSSSPTTTVQPPDSQMDIDAPLRTPRKPQSAAGLSPRKRKDPMSILFIPKKPAPIIVNAKQSIVARKATYLSPFSPRAGRQLLSYGPRPGIYNGTVQQTSFCPEGQEFDVRDPNTFVVFGKSPETGCLLPYPDAVSPEKFDIPYQRIILKFQWAGYEACGIREKEIEIDHNNHFEARIFIIERICAMFQSFKKDVQNMVMAGDLKLQKEYPDVLALGTCDVRVLGLQRCHDHVYQPIFTVPTRRRD